MDRKELDKLSRNELVALAEKEGVSSPAHRTRPELIDELLLRDHQTSPEQKKRVRGFFGVARDLLSRVIERGLHLPDLYQADLTNAAPISVPPPSEPIPTFTLAEIYLKQGHRVKAIQTLRELALQEPNNVEVQNRLSELEQTPSLLVLESEESLKQNDSHERQKDEAFFSELKEENEDAGKSDAEEISVQTSNQWREDFFEVHALSSEESLISWKNKPRKTFDSTKKSRFYLRILIVSCDTHNHITTKTYELVLLASEYEAGEHRVTGLDEASVVRAFIGERKHGDEDTFLLLKTAELSSELKELFLSEMGKSPRQAFFA